MSVTPKTARRPKKVGKNRLTIFSFGYKGWGNATLELKQAIDAVEESRECQPPYFVDVRISQSVQAVGFKGGAFAKLVGADRHAWARGMGNLKVLTRTGPQIQIADPGEAEILLDLAEGAAEDPRRVIFFCACQWPKEDGKITCHRTEVGTLLLKEAKRRGIEAEVVEWPGGKPTHIDLTADRRDFDSICRGLKYIPLAELAPVVALLGLPWGSTATVRCGDDHIHCTVGRAIWQVDHWGLPVLDRQERNGNLADYEPVSASVVQAYGLTPRTTEGM